MKLYNGNKHYNLNPMLNLSCTWNGVLSERSNGKSFAVMQFCIIEALDNGRGLAYIRRNDKEITQSAVEDYFTDKNLLKWLKKETGYDGFLCDRFTKEIFFYTYTENGKKARGARLGKAFSVESQLAYKSQHFDYICNAVYEEFITNKPYLSDEWGEFNNLLSTLFRKRKDVKAFLLGNTVSRECPYLREFGIDIYKVKKNTINVAELEQTDGRKIKFAFEWAEPKEEESGIFFGKVSKEIVSGEWSAREYPHLFVSLNDVEILYTFFMINNLGNAWKCVEFLYNDAKYVYVYPFDYEAVQYYPTFDVFTDELDEVTMQKKNYFIHPDKRRHRKIFELFRAGHFVYATNLCGTEFNNSLKRYNPFR